ncbi:MAG TPA: group III truncated hemoglobin [Caulobacteraceae bacterium]|jgi:hemoglobin
MTLQDDTLADDLSAPLFADLVRDFYGRARLDPMLGPVFEAGVHDWEVHIGRVAAFWAQAAMGLRGYHGNPLAAHRKHALTPQMFDRWLEIWDRTVDARVTPDLAEPLKARARLIAESLKLGLFFTP